ncbi:hypothetical protein KQY13_19195 [Streptomyces sp. PAM3C]|nr:hypothetical protein [Streptomyces sp. PAM3C]
MEHGVPRAHEPHARVLRDGEVPARVGPLGPGQQPGPPLPADARQGFPALPQPPHHTVHPELPHPAPAGLVTGFDDTGEEDPAQQAAVVGRRGRAAVPGRYGRAA